LFRDREHFFFGWHFVAKGYPGGITAFVVIRKRRDP